MHIRPLVTIAVACLVTQATHTLLLADWQPGSGDTLNLYVAGASAQDDALGFRLQCEEDTRDMDRVGGDQRLLCRLVHS